MSDVLLKAKAAYDEVVRESPENRELMKLLRAANWDMPRIEALAGELGLDGNRLAELKTLGHSLRGGALDLARKCPAAKATVDAINERLAEIQADRQNLNLTRKQDDDLANEEATLQSKRRVAVLHYGECRRKFAQVQGMIAIGLVDAAELEPEDTKKPVRKRGRR